MLFKKDNKDLDSYTVCGESKWRTDTHLNKDSAISSRKKTFNEGVKVVSTHPTATKAIHVGAYCALYEVAYRRPHQG
jgi:hypothetical protein